MILSANSLTAMRKEMEKIALGFAYLQDPQPGPGVQSRLGEGVAGEHGTRVMRTPTGPRARTAVVIRHPDDPIFHQFDKALEFDPEVANRFSAAQHRHTKLHEITHHLRTQQGKMEGYGRGGVRNIARTLREEAAANIAAQRAFKSPVEKILGGAMGAQATLGSTSRAYGGVRGLYRSALSGKLKRVGHLAQKVGLW